VPASADRSHDEQIITACGEKPAYGYRRVVWWLGRHHGLAINGKRALRVMRERGLLDAAAPLSGLAEKGLGQSGSTVSESRLAVRNMTKVWAGPSVGWAYLSQ